MQILKKFNFWQRVKENNWCRNSMATMLSLSHYILLHCVAHKLYKHFFGVYIASLCITITAVDMREFDIDYTLLMCYVLPSPTFFFSSLVFAHEWNTTSFLKIFIFARKKLREKTCEIENEREREEIVSDEGIFFFRHYFVFFPLRMANFILTLRFIEVVLIHTCF